jgi:hypothetical protein
MKAIQRLTNGFLDGSKGIFSVGCSLTTLSAPTHIPGRSRKFAPCSNIKLWAVQEMTSKINELYPEYNLPFGNLTNA